MRAGEGSRCISMQNPSRDTHSEHDRHVGKSAPCDSQAPCPYSASSPAAATGPGRLERSHAVLPPGCWASLHCRTCRTCPGLGFCQMTLQAYLSSYEPVDTSYAAPSGSQGPMHLFSHAQSPLLDEQGCICCTSHLGAPRLEVTSVLFTTQQELDVQYLRYARAALQDLKLACGQALQAARSLIDWHIDDRNNCNPHQA